MPFSLTPTGPVPGVTNTFTLGSSSLKWANIYATTFTGGSVTQTIGDNSTNIATTAYVNNSLISAMWFQEQVDDGHDQGDHTGANALTTRKLNTSYGSISEASLDTSSYQITLPPGTYRINASAPAFKVNQHRIGLYDVTSTPLLVMAGTSENTSSNTDADPIQSRSFINGMMTITTTAKFELQHFTELATIDGTGLGRCSHSEGMGKEVYAILEVIKLV